MLAAPSTALLPPPQQLSNSGTCGSVLKHGSFCVASCSSSRSRAARYNLGNGSYGLGNGTVITGMCTGNTDPTEDVACPSGFVVGHSTVGACVGTQLCHTPTSMLPH